MKASKRKKKSSDGWELLLAELRDAKDRDALLEKLLATAACYLKSVQVFAAKPEELRGFMALVKGRCERADVRERALPTSAPSLAVTAAKTGILNLGPVAESEPALALLPPGARADHGLVFLPIWLKERTVFLLIGTPKEKIKPDLRARMSQLSQEAAVALAEIILQAKAKRSPAEVTPQRAGAPVQVKGPATGRSKLAAPAKAAAAPKSRQQKKPQAPAATSEQRPQQPQIAAIDTALLNDLDWDLDLDLLGEKKAD